MTVERHYKIKHGLDVGTTFEVDDDTHTAKLNGSDIVTQKNLTDAGIDTKYQHPLTHPPSIIDFTGTDKQFMTDVQTVSLEGKIDSIEKGVANGVATLNEFGIIPLEQIPGNINYIEEIAGLVNFPETGNSNKFYVDLLTGTMYRWDSLTLSYVNINELSENTDNMGMYRTGKDVNDIFTNITYRRMDGTLYKTSILYGTTPDYSTRVMTVYAFDGIRVLSEITYDLVYDANHNVIEEVVNIP